MRFRVFNIEYDTDRRTIKGLPKELIVEIKVDDIEDIGYDLSNEVSDITGWCVSHLEYEPIDE